MIYYYIGLFAFAQFLDFGGLLSYDKASSGIAVVSLVLLIVLPLLLATYLIVNITTIQ